MQVGSGVGNPRSGSGSGTGILLSAVESVAGIPLSGGGNGAEIPLSSAGSGAGMAQEWHRNSTLLLGNASGILSSGSGFRIGIPLSAVGGGAGMKITSCAELFCCKIHYGCEAGSIFPCGVVGVTAITCSFLM